MKIQSFTQLSAFALLLMVVFTTGCKKDEIPPVVTLIGDASVELALFDTYTDAGATALDDEDGDLTSDIVVSNPVKTDMVGTYTVVYTASDEEGNTGTAARNVSVSVMQSNFIGLWAESDNCNAAVTANDNVNIVAGSLDNEVRIIDFLDLIGGNLTIVFDGFDLIVPVQTFGSVITTDVSGTGSLNADADVVTLDLTFDTAIGSESCTLTYNKF